MLTFETIPAAYREFCNQFPELKPGEVVLSAGGACVIHECRKETADLDLDIPKWLFDKLLAQAKPEDISKCIPLDTTVVRFSPTVDIHESSPDTVSEMIAGVYVYDMDTLLKQKLKLNREKDKDDIHNLIIAIAKEKEQLAREDKIEAENAAKGWPEYGASCDY